MMASKRSADHLASGEAPQYKKAALGRMSDPGPPITTPHELNPVQQRTQPIQKIVKLPIAQSGQHLPDKKPVCSGPAAPHATNLDTGSSIARTTPSGSPIPVRPRISSAEYRAFLLDEQAKEPEKPPATKLSRVPTISQTSSIARTQLADIGNTIASLEAQLREARQQIASRQQEARREQQLSKDNANTIRSMRAEFDEMKRTQTSLEAANANLKARCNDFAKERKEKLQLQEQLKQDQAIHDQCQHEKKVLEEKLEQAMKTLAEHLENTRIDNAASELLKLMVPSDLGRIADVLAQLKSLLENRA